MDRRASTLPSRSPYAGLDAPTIAQQYLTWVTRTKALAIVGVVVLGAVAISAGTSDSPLAAPIWIALLIAIIGVNNIVRGMLASRYASLLQIITVDLDPQLYANVACELGERAHTPLDRSAAIVELARATYYTGQFQDALAVLQRAIPHKNAWNNLGALFIELSCHHKLGNTADRDRVFGQIKEIRNKTKSGNRRRSLDNMIEAYELSLGDPRQWSVENGKRIAQLVNEATDPATRDSWLLLFARYELEHGEVRHADEIVREFSSRKLLPSMHSNLIALERDLDTIAAGNRPLEHSDDDRL